jgi:rSAM/selenodomain-associated transferase 2
MEISVIIPTYNEETTVVKALDALERLVNVSEVVVVDGGSTDSTCAIVEEYRGLKPLKLIKLDEPNRGRQLDEGTRHANGDVYWFLHADTRPVQGCARHIKSVLRYSEVIGGNFEIQFDGRSRWARFLTWLYPHLRSIGLVYGDSAFFVSREAYEKIGGFRPYGVFEDLDLFHRLRRLGRFMHLKQHVVTSSRRFQSRSFLLTFARWSLYQGLYWAGIPPRILARYYFPVR